MTPSINRYCFIMSITNALRYQTVEQFEFFDVPSPCIGICNPDQRGYCKGCLRNRNERFNWLNFDDEKKRNILTLLVQRKRRRMLAILKSKKRTLFDQKAANELFDADTEELVKAVIEKPDLIKSLDEDKLNLLWAFLKFFFMPLLVGAILLVFQKNYEQISAHFTGADDAESIKLIAEKGTLRSTNGNWAIVIAKNLNFREGPLLSAPIVSSLELGEPIEIIDDMGRDWLYVRAMVDDELDTGWIHRDYVVSIKSN